MAFRYEIWQYNSGDEYDIASYQYYDDVTPLDSAFNLSVEKEKDKFYYRVKANGEIVFSGADYDLIADIVDSCEPYLLFVYDDCSGRRSFFIQNNFWDKADFIGIIKKTNIKRDYDRCSISVEIDTFDIYSKFLRDIDINRGLYGTRVRTFFKTYPHPIKTNRYSVNSSFTPSTTPQEMQIHFIDENGTFPGDFLFDLTGAEVSVLQETKYYPHPTAESVWIHKLTYISERFKGASAPDDGTTWYNVGTNIWARYPIEPVNLSYDHYESDPDNGWYRLKNTVRPVDMARRNRAVSYQDRMNTILNQMGYGAVESIFLFSENNPITTEKNPLRNLLLMHQSDVKAKSDVATKYDMTLDDMINYVSVFNTGWFLKYDKNKDRVNLVIEHKRYFDRGYNYTSNNYGMNDRPPNLRNRLIIESDASKLEKTATFRWGTMESNAFLPVFIEYQRGCTGDTENSIDVSPLSTDFHYVHNNPETAPDDGIMLISATARNGNDFSIVAKQLNGRWTINSDLTPQNIVEKYWTHSSPTSTAIMKRDSNYPGQSLSILSLKRTKIRSDFIIDTRSYKRIEPRYLMATSQDIVPYRLCQVESAEYSPRNNTWKLTLLYE